MNQGNLTAEQLRIIAMNSSNPQQVMSTNGDQSQLLKQLVMSSAANFNNFPQTTTQTSNMNQGLLPTTSSSMYNLSTSMNNSLQQLNTSQHLNSSIPNTFNNPAQIPTSVRQSSSSPQNLPDLNNVVNSLLKDTEEKPTPVTMQDQLNNSVNQLNTSAVNQLNTSALNNSVNQLNNSALNSAALQQMSMKDQMLVKQKMMEMQMLSQNQQAVDRMIQNSQDESARIEALSQQQQLFQQQLQQQQVKWFYRDPQGHIQGVFSKEQMSEWHSAGYFKNDLELRVEVGSKVCHVTLGQLIELNNGQIPFNISGNLLQLPPQRPQQQPVVNGHAPEQNIKQLQLYMGQQLKELKAKHDLVYSQSVHSCEKKLEDFNQRLLASVHPEAKFRGRSREEIDPYLQAQSSNYTQQLQMELQQIRRQLDTAYLTEQKMYQIKLSQMQQAQQQQIPVTTQQQIQHQELQNNQHANMNQSLNASLNQSHATMNQSHTGMINGVTNGWIDPAIVQLDRSQGSAQSHDMMKMLKEKTDLQAQRMPQQQSSFQQYRMNQNLMRQRSQQYNQQQQQLFMGQHTQTFFTQT